MRISDWSSDLCSSDLDCMTYSIGFRAPSRGELIADWCDHLLDSTRDDDRYDDPNLQVQKNPGEISAQAITQLHAMVIGKMLDRDAFARWFGQYNSTPKYADMDWQPEEPIQIDELREALGDNVPLCRNPASRFSFIRQRANSVLLFVDGECFECVNETSAFAEQLCAQDRVRIDPDRSEEHTSELQSLMRISYAVFCLKK